MEIFQQSTGHENVLVYTTFVLQWEDGGSLSVRQISALATWKETDRGAPSTSTLPAIPWWSRIHHRVVISARLLSMRPRSLVSAQPLWIALRSDWLSVHMAVASNDRRGHSNATSHILFVIWWGNRCSVLLLREEGRGVGRVSFCYHHSCTSVLCFPSLGKWDAFIARYEGPTSWERERENSNVSS